MRTAAYQSRGPAETGLCVARSRSPLGPFTKRSASILRSNGTWAGPGHNSVVRTGGKAYMVYHAWDAPHACGDPGGRHLMIDAISWKGGWPVVNNGTPSRTVRQAPTIPRSRVHRASEQARAASSSSRALPSGARPDRSYTMSVLDSIQGMVTPGLIDSLGQKFGLSPATLAGSMDGLAGTVMSGVAGKASDRSSMDSLSGLVNESPNEPQDFDRLADAPDDSPMKRRGNQLLDLATGGNPSMLAGIGSMLGIGGGAATGLLGSVAALAMGALRKLGRTRRLDSSSLAALLHSESKSYRDAIPAAWRGHIPDVEHPQRARAVAIPRQSWWPLLAILVAAVAIWGLTRSRREHRETRRPETSQTYQPQGHARMGEPPAARAPGGTAESKLLAEARSPQPTGQSIPLDKVTFATGSSTLEPASDDQLSRVARVLDRNPLVRVNVAGYPDSAAAKNEELSRARAASVRDALVQKGVAGSRIQIATGREAAPAAGRETAFGHVSIQVLPGDNRG